MPKSKEFLSSDSGSGSDSDEPKPKKKKVKESKPDKTEDMKSSEKAYTKGPNGEKMFEIGKMRFATVSEFKGKVLVSIREYYTPDDGSMRPGKKGISLSVDQWNSFKKVISDVDEVVKSM